MTARPDLVLVTGATGSVGRHLVTALLDAGVRVRALTRTPASAALPAGAELVRGAFGDLPPGVFDGVGAAFVFPAAGASGFATRAAAAGVRHLVLLSSLAAALEHPRDRGSVSQLHHSAVEDAVRASGAAWTVLRPGTFANNLLAWAPSIRATGSVSGPYPTSAQAPVHEADVAGAAAAVLTRGGHEGRTYPITGPQALTRLAQLETIGAATGRRLVFHETSPQEFRAQAQRYGMAQPVVDMVLDHWRDTVEVPDAVRSAEPVTGRPARTLAQWAREHAAEFGASSQA